MAHISKCRTSANKDQIVFHFSTISTHMFHTENTNSHQFATISILHFESKGPQDFKSKCRNWGPRSRKRRKLGSTSAWLTCKIMQRHGTAAQNRRVVRYATNERHGDSERLYRDWNRQVDTKRHSVGQTTRPMELCIMCWSSSPGFIESWAATSTQEQVIRKTVDVAKKTLWKLQSDCGWKRWAKEANVVVT